MVLAGVSCAGLGGGVEPNEDGGGCAINTNFVVNELGLGELGEGVGFGRVAKADTEQALFGTVVGFETADLLEVKNAGISIRIVTSIGVGLVRGGAVAIKLVARGLLVQNEGVGVLGVPCFPIYQNRGEEGERCPR